MPRPLNRKHPVNRRVVSTVVHGTLASSKPAGLPGYNPLPLPPFTRWCRPCLLPTRSTSTLIGLRVERVLRNLSPAGLYEEAIRHESGASIADSGALIAYSGDKTGRSPKDKRVVKHPDSQDEVWWGAVNIAIEEKTFDINLQRARDYLNTRPAAVLR